MLVRRAEVLTGSAGGRGLRDVRIDRGFVTAVGPPGQRLERRAGEAELDAAGGALLPGLHDHHVHLMSLAASLASTQLGPPAVTDRPAFARTLATAAAAAAAARSRGGDGWVRGIGYHPSVAGDLDRWSLDALTGDVPTRVQHRGGALWVLNSAALRAVGLSSGSGSASSSGPTSSSRSSSPAGSSGAAGGEGVERTAAGAPTGRLWRLDSWLASRIPRIAADLAAVGRTALAAGVTGFTDATPERRPADAAALARAVATGALPQRLALMLPSTEPVPPGPLDPSGAGPHDVRLTAGPVKIILDDTDLPSPDALAPRIRAAHRAGAAVAVHCVTRVQLVVALAAIQEAGPDPGGRARPADRIEHGAVIPPELAELVRAAGLTVVTQPNFVAERGDVYLAEVDPEDLPWLYPCRSLLATGVAVAAGTDAPFGHPDPWRAVRAATRRRTAAGALLGGDERVDGRTALDLFLGHPDTPAQPRRIRPGLPADLCLLRGSLDEALADPDAARVAATLIDGALAHTAG